MGAFRYTFRSFLTEIAVIVGATIFALPFYLLIVISLKSDEAMVKDPYSFPFGDAQFSNYAKAWQEGGVTGGLGQAFLNTLLITACTVILIVLIASFTSYVIARQTSKVSNAVYVMFVVGFIVPFTLGLVPIYVFMREAGLLATYQGIILIHTAGLLPYAVFLYVGFIRALPVEFEEAAQIDGAGIFRTFFKVVMPLLRPITTTVALLTGLIVWNDFFISIIFMSGSPLATLPVALNSYVNANFTQWNLVFAGAVIAIAPVLIAFVFAQRQFIRGFAGGIRG